MVSDDFYTILIYVIGDIDGSEAKRLLLLQCSQVQLPLSTLSSLQPLVGNSSSRETDTFFLPQVAPTLKHAQIHTYTHG